MNAYLLSANAGRLELRAYLALEKVHKAGYPGVTGRLALGFIETRLKRIVPDYLYPVVVPVCSLILAVFSRPHLYRPLVVC